MKRGQGKIGFGTIINTVSTSCEITRQDMAARGGRGGGGGGGRGRGGGGGSDDNGNYSRKRFKSGNDEGGSSSGAPSLGVSSTAPTAPLTPVQQLFTTFGQHMDKRSEVRESIYKITRDVTKASKKIIGSLQRCSQKGLRESILQQAKLQFYDIHVLLNETHMLLTSTEFFSASQGGSKDDAESGYWRYLRSFSFGLQEYIEAVSFYWYLARGELISLDELEEFVRITSVYPEVFDTVKDKGDANTTNTAEVASQAVAETATNTPTKPTATTQTTKPAYLRIRVEDYILGLCDLTGELMRFATHAGTSGDTQTCTEVCAFIRQIYLECQKLQIRDKDWAKKLSVMEECLCKVETVCYKLNIRLSEYPASMLEALLMGGVEDDHAAGGGDNDFS